MFQRARIKIVWAGLLLHCKANPGTIHISHCREGGPTRDEVSEFDFHVQRAEIPLLRPRSTEPDKGHVPSSGFTALEKGSDRWIQHGLKRNPYTSGQFFSEVKPYPRHLPRRGVPYYV